MKRMEMEFSDISLSEKRPKLEKVMESVNKKSVLKVEIWHLIADQLPCTDGLGSIWCPKELPADISIPWNPNAKPDDHEAQYARYNATKDE